MDFQLNSVACIAMLDAYAKPGSESMPEGAVKRKASKQAMKQARQATLYEVNELLAPLIGVEARRPILGVARVDARRRLSQG